MSIILMDLDEGKEARELKQGDVVVHFKYETNPDPEAIKAPRCEHCYSIITADAYSTEANDEDQTRYVVYKALYNNKIWIRAYDEFISEVYHDKYPDIKTKYRFTKVNPEESLGFMPPVFIG